MARIVLEAVATGGGETSSGVARPGNRHPLLIVISAARYSGVPVTGLQATHFLAQALIVAPGGGIVTVQSVAESVPGIYLMKVVPGSAADWRPGRYLFWLKAERASDVGQTVFEVLLS